MRTGLGFALTAGFSIIVSAAIAQQPDSAAIQIEPRLGYRRISIDAPVFERIAADRIRAAGGVIISDGEYSLKAQQIEGNPFTQSWYATGGVSLNRSEIEVLADRISYSGEEMIGLAYDLSGKYGDYYIRGETAEVAPDNTITVHNGLGTTCNLDHPHWSIRARTITVTGERSGVANGLGLYIGDRKLLSLPSYRLTQGQSGSDLLPSPGLNKRDGLYLRYGYPFVARGFSAAQIQGILSQRNGLLTTLELQRALPNVNDPAAIGNIEGDIPSDLTEVGLVSKSLSPSRRPLFPGQQVKSDESIRRVTQAYLRFANKEQTFDPDVKIVYLDRLPEVGFRSFGLPIAKVSGEGNYAFINSQVSYGRFRERESRQWHNRLDARASLRVKAGIGSQLLIEPALMARYAKYSTGDNFQMLAASIAAGRNISKQAFLSVTYVRNFPSGRTPFEFDDLDVAEKLAARLDTDFGSIKGRFSVDFDLSRGGLYDWSIDLRRLFHCYETRIKYSHRFRDISFGVNIIKVEWP